MLQRRPEHTEAKAPPAVTREKFCIGENYVALRLSPNRADAGTRHVVQSQLIGWAAPAPHQLFALADDEARGSALDDKGLSIAPSSAYIRNASASAASDTPTFEPDRYVLQSSPRSDGP